jgi:hypothetical protein
MCRFFALQIFGIFAHLGCIKNNNQQPKKDLSLLATFPIMDVMLDGIKVTESDSYLGLQVYYETPVVKNPLCPKTKGDCVGEGARADPDQDYEVERQEHNWHVALYHTPLEAGPFCLEHPLPLKTWSPSLLEKEMDDQDGGFGTVFWPNWKSIQDQEDHP